MYLGMNDQQSEIEVGYALHKQYWNNGYATELARAFLEWGFRHLSVDKFVAILRPENAASRRVLEKSGMRYAGMFDYNNKQVAFYEIFKSTTDYNKITLIAATEDDYPIIQSMGTYYVYDMSEYMGSEKGWEIPEDGIYECMDFKKYWEDVNSFPFVIRYDGELAGFAIVDKKGSDATIEFNMAQFFIFRKFKHKGIARFVAEKCFDKFKGVWEVMVMPGNEGAYRFWRSTIKKYTDNHFIEYTKKVEHFKTHQHNIFKFDSKIKR
jgi:predicted acetyltransferase